MAEKKYKVAKDVALTAKGVIYKSGDVLPEDLLDKKQKETLTKAKKIVEVTAEDEKKDDDAAKNDDGGKKSDDATKNDDGSKKSDDAAKNDKGGNK